MLLCSVVYACVLLERATVYVCICLVCVCLTVSRYVCVHCWKGRMCLFVYSFCVLRICPYSCVVLERAPVSCCVCLCIVVYVYSRVVLLDKASVSVCVLLCLGVPCYSCVCIFVYVWNGRLCSDCV